MHDLSAIKDVNLPGSEVDFYDNGIGIVHIGVGAFHRAHQAVYTNDVLEKFGGDWRIMGVSLQSTGVADALNAQDGVYSLTIRDGNSDLSKIKLIKSIHSVEAAVRSKQRIFEQLASENTRIVSTTVTEKAYGILREAGEVDTTHPGIAQDLKNPHDPASVIGFVVKGLADRKKKGRPPYTVMCCDNLPNNGDLLRAGTLDYAKRTFGPELADWIDENGAFPNTMVDRITPATTQALKDETANKLGVVDAAPIETEGFTQWVIEDKFACGRPKWEEVGVLFVNDVAPFEEMKLRMLNGAHSLIAYAGFQLGHAYVRDAMADVMLKAQVSAHMHAAARTLQPLEAISFDSYAEQLVERFSNPHIAHETYQIAMDGSQKIQQRIFAPAVDALAAGLPLDDFAFATAAWIAYCSGRLPDGKKYDLRDPRQDELTSAFESGEGDPDRIVASFMALPELFPKALISEGHWRKAVTNYLGEMLANGVRSALENKTLAQ